ncbi:MAG: ion transporter [Oscillospiraceae bacterium]|nr:ion transporter [Candidatus Ruminococcus equi]
MRRKIFEIVETADTDNRASSIYDFFMIFVIILSLIPLAFKTEYYAFTIIDKVCAIIFIIDYLLRWITADYKYNDKSIKSFIRYPFSPMAIIDLLSILPSLSILSNGFRILRIIRMLRAMRVLRVFKMFRYSKSIKIITGVFKKSKEPLITVGTLALVYILISALVIINVEPDSFNNFFDAIYWATVSLTTMGYGDIYPVTTLGRIVTMVSSIFGIAIVALPAGIITAGYMSEIENSKDDDK